MKNMNEMCAKRSIRTWPPCLISFAISCLSELVSRTYVSQILQKKGYLRELKTITNWTWDIHRRVWLLGYFIPIVFFPRSLIWTDTRPAGKTATEANISVTYYLSIFDFLLVCDLLLIYRHLLFVSINLIPYWSLIQFFAPEFL